MATGLLGHIEEFDPSVEEWKQYVERLEQFLQANDITGEDKAVKRRATFLSVIGRSAYNLLRSLLAPTKPTDKIYEQLVEILTKHYSPAPTEVMQSFRFNSRARKDGESIANYVAELRRLAEGCNYGDSLKKMLHDRLVWGVKDTTIQKKLLAETDLTLDKAIQLAQSSETAEKNLKEMEGETPRDPVHQIRKPSGCLYRKGSGTTKTSVIETRENCSRCGKLGHPSDDCPFRERVCYKCQSRGHLAKMCRSSSNPKKGCRREKKGRQHVRRLESEESSSELEDFLDLVTEVGEINRLHQPPIKVPVRVDSVQVQMELDTGA